MSFTAEGLPPLIRPLASALEGRYTIEREIGRGGMATVYLARDARHNRPVALKVLNPELGAVLGVERFLAEIQVTANLQHPNLLPLFDSGEAVGLLFYVMPFVVGESLRVRIDRDRQLPVDEAVRIAAAVASALDYAHRHGVIHRDLKPENILLSEGQPLIADFGIALAVSNAGGNRITQTGLSLGTPQYMSPEQATGDRAIDGRTDVYSLGAVLYEMLCGEPPHTGSTAQAVVARVLTESPRPVRTNRPSVPEPLEAAVLRALEKLPADRWQTAGQFGEAIVGSTSTSYISGAARGAARSAARPRRRDGLVMGLASVALVATALSIYLWRAPRGTVETHAVRFPLVTPGIVAGPLTASASVAISRDGSAVAFIGERDNHRHLYLHNLSEEASRPLAGTEGAQAPFFSPDGSLIGFWAGGRLFKVSIAGGTPIPIADVPVTAGAAWVRPDLIVVSQGNALYTVNAGGGPLELLTRADTAHGEAAQMFPDAIGDGERVLYTSTTPARASATTRVGIASVKTRTATILPVNGFKVGVVDGRLIYTDAASGLFAIPVDIARGKVTGSPTVIANDVLVSALGPNSSMSGTGTLVYESAAANSELILADMQGRTHPALRELKPFDFPRFSPDGKTLAVSIDAGAGTDIWTYELATGATTRQTTDGARNGRVEWTPDGRNIIYRSDRQGRSAIWMQQVDQSTPPRALLTSPRVAYYEAVMTRDGKYLVFQQDTVSSDIGFRRMTGDTTMGLITNSPSYNESMARVSPDGHWVAYLTDESGAQQVIVQPFPTGGARTQVSANGGSEPVWSPDGGTLYYRDGSHFVAARVATSPSFVVKSRTTLFEDTYVRTTSPHANYDVTPDGKELLVLKSVSNSVLVVVHNWTAELRAKAGRR